MKREILFRGKQLSNGEFIEGSLTVDCHGNCCIYHPLKVPIGGGFQYFDIDPETVGQFTGITDIHGRKVFEGDILSCKKADGASLEYKCVYNDENACFYFTNTKYGLSLSGDEMLYFDVIGNIHDLKLKL